VVGGGWGGGWVVGGGGGGKVRVAVIWRLQVVKNAEKMFFGRMGRVNVKKAESNLPTEI